MCVSEIVCECVHAFSCMCRYACVMPVSMSVCSPLPGKQTLVSKYLARRGVVVSGGWSNGSGWQQTTK